MCDIDVALGMRFVSENSLKFAIPYLYLACATVVIMVADINGLDVVRSVSFATFSDFTSPVM